MEMSTRHGDFVDWTCCQCRKYNKADRRITKNDFEAWSCNGWLVDYKTMAMDKEAVGAQPVPGRMERMFAKLRRFLGEDIQPPTRYIPCGHKFFHCMECEPSHGTSHRRATAGGANPLDLKGRICHDCLVWF